MKKIEPVHVLGRIFLFAFATSSFPLETEVEAETETDRTNLAVIVRHAPSLNGGTIQGSLQQLNGENMTINSGFTMTGDLLVPGVPTVVSNGRPVYSGTISGTGAASPTGYRVTFNGNTSLRYLRTRTTPVSLPTVSVPPSPAGTRTVNINSAGQSYGDASTLRNLTLNGNVGMIAVPPGTYGSFTANGGSGFVLGVVGGLQAMNYNLQNLNLNGGSTLKITGPVVLTLANGFNGNGAMGASNNPAWLQLQLANGGFTLNGGCAFYGQVLAPNGTVIINGNSTLIGTLITDQFILNGGGMVQRGGAVTQTNQPPVAAPQNITLPENSLTNITLTGSDQQGRTQVFTLLTPPAHGTLSGAPPNVTYKPATNYFGSDTFTFKVNNGILDSPPATISLNVTRVYYPPTAFSQTVTNYQNTALPVTLTGSDPQGYSLNYFVMTQPGHGTLSGPTPNLIYRPATNYYGNDSFTFRVNNGITNSPATVINITNQPVDYPPIVVAGPDQLIILPISSVTLNGSVYFSPYPRTTNTIVWSKVSGPGAVIFSNPSNSLTSATFSQSGVYKLRLFATDSFLSNSNDLTVIVDAPPVVNAGQALTNNFPGTITLTGFASDDGLLTNAPLTAIWNKISGPGTVTFGNAAATNSAAIFSTNGIYMLRLTVDDGIATNHSDITVIENLPPLVNAGSTQTVNFGATVTLAGMIADDELPDSILTSVWNKISGPGNAAFANATATNTTVIFDQSGIYVLSLTADDGFSTNSSNVTVIINQPPTVSVMADELMVQLPSTATLSGIVSDDGIPNGILNNTWSQVSGPVTALFSNVSGTNTTASFSQPGIYILRLTADDTMATSSGEISVNVLPVLNANHAPQAFGQSLNVNEGEPLAITLNGMDPDGDALTFNVIIPPTHGTLSGSASDLIYLPETGYTGDDAFVFVANDGKADSGPAIVYILINPLNYAPIISVPADQTVTENPILQFDIYKAISVFDADAGSDLLQLSLAVTHGTLILGTTSGLLWVTGSNGSSNIVVKGSLDDLNNSLAGLTYIGATGFVGSDSLEISVDDLGHAGSVGNQVDSKSITIIINPAVHFSKSATAGTNFWVARLPGLGTTRMRWIMLLAEQDTSVTVIVPDRYTQFHDDGTFSTAPGGTSTIELQAGVPFMGALEQLNRFSPVLTSGTITNSAFKISSTELVSVFVTDFSFNDSDAFRALPTEVLGTNYVITAYGNFQLFPGNVFGSQFSVTAAENETEVVIVPAVSTGDHPAGQPFTVTLQQGQTFGLRHTETATGDLTGSTLTASKPVAVLAGNAFATIPPGEGSASDISEQLMPVEHWDSEYVVTHLAGRASYAMRVVAAYDGTAVQLSGLGETNLNRGQFCELLLTNDLHVIVSQPVAVCQYALGDPSDSLPGTPTMICVPGVHQGLTDSQWMTSEAVQTVNFGGRFSAVPLYTNFVNLVVPGGAFASLRINGDPLPSDASWNIVGNGEFIDVCLPVTNGVYHIHCSEPVVTINYGVFENVAGYGLGSYGLAGPFSLPVFPLNVQVAVASPTNGSVVIAGVETSVVANISDPQNLVTNVEFRVDGNKISEGATTNFTWTPVQAGNYALQFVASALTGDSVTSSPVNVTVSYDFTSQGVLIVSPYDGESAYVNGLTLIALDFDDPLGLFDYAEFFANNVSLGETTNTVFNWVPSSTNDYVLSAIIYDFLGNAYPATNTVMVHAILPPRPQLAITSPTDGSRVRVGVESVIIASLFDPGNLTTNVQFFADSVKVSDNSTYYSWTPAQIGGHALQAIALTSDGENVSSAIVNVTVAEMFPPVVNLLSPTNNQLFASGIAPLLSAQAVDSDGLITNLTLTLDNTTVAETNLAFLSVTATNARPGWHQAVAEAADNDGLTASSEIVSFFVERSVNTALPVPGQFAARALSATEIELSWSPVGTNGLPQNILVQRWDFTGLQWIEITQVPVVSTNCLDSALDPETYYRYRIACIDGNGNRSAFTAETNATTRTVVPNYAVIDLSTAVASSLTNLVPGGSLLTNAGLTQFDSRRTVPLGTLHAESILGSKAAVLRQAVARFTEQWPQIQLDYDPILLSPHSIMPRVGYLTGPGGAGMTVSAATAQMFDPADTSQPVKAFLKEHQDLFGFGPEEITNAVVNRDYISALNGARTTVWQQQVGGIPVFNALFIGHMTSVGELAAVACDFIPAPAQSANSNVLTAVQNSYSLPLTGAQALQAAVNNVGDVFAPADIISQSVIQGIARSQSYVAAKGIKGAAHAGLTWFPASRNELKLAWQVTFTSQWRNEMYLALVSAEDGEILYRRNLTADSSDASYRVYTDSSPAPMSPGWSMPGNVQPPLVDRSLVTITALDTNASPIGWINDDDNQTLGNNVDARLDRNDDNLPDLPRPVGNPSRVFDFGLDLGLNPVTYGDASVVQLFYWDNWMHDVLYGLGFTEAAGNFQSDNFGRGGQGGDSLQADAQDGLSLTDRRYRNNGNMSTPPDGHTPLMQIYVFDGANPARDGSLDAEIILHEYTHGLSARFIGGGAGIDAQQTMGMSEGWSDFFALALLNDPSADPDAAYPVGSYVAYHGFGTMFDENYYYGIRHYPYCTDTNKNPLTFADIDPGQASAHAGVPCSPLTGPLNPALADEPHVEGEIWCIMLWEMRAALIHKLGAEAGNRLALQLVTDGMRLSPPNPNFVQARNAILLADRILSNDAEAPEIWAAFSKRGLGYDAKAPYSYTTAGVQESFSSAPALVVEQIVIQSDDGSANIGTNTDFSLFMAVYNQGTATAQQVAAQITTTTPGVQILQSQSAYGDIPQNQSRGNSVLLQVHTLPGFVAGTLIDLNFTINSVPHSVTSRHRLYTINLDPVLPNNDNSSAEPTSDSAVPKDLTPYDLGNLEPLWMADDASCLLKAGLGKYILWRPGVESIPMINPNFLAHRLTRHGIVVGELVVSVDHDIFGDMFTNTVGAKWIPGQTVPTPLTAGFYAYPKDSLVGQNVGLAYDLINLTAGLPTYLGGVARYPEFHSVWDMNDNGQSAGAASVYLRPSDLDEDGFIGTNDVRFGTLQQSEFDAQGRIDWMQSDERTLSAGHSGSAIRRVDYNALLTTATRFETDATWNWVGPINFSGGSVFSVGLLINDQGDVAGTGATRTGNALFDASSPTRVFRWNSSDGEFSLGGPHVHELEPLPGGQHAFPLAMNQAGDIVGYSDQNIYDLNQNKIHATYWSAATTSIQDLGTLGMTPGNSQAFAIDDSQQIVGVSQKADGNPAAVLWRFNHNTNSPAGNGFWESTDLNGRSSENSWDLLNAVGINTDGLILAYAKNTAGENHAVLLATPQLAVDNDRDGRLHLTIQTKRQPTSLIVFG
ncbi:MAG: M36 family metallopeptidase [Limisphaerales bacterium]